MSTENSIIATGRRKTAVARVVLSPGEGKITINNRSFDDYLPSIQLQNTVLKPLEIANAVKSFDCVVNATGGGVAGPGRRHPPGHCPRAAGDRPDPASGAQGGGDADPRLPHEGAQEVGPARRPQALPVLEALNPRTNFSEKAAFQARPFLLVAPRAELRFVATGGVGRCSSIIHRHHSPADK